MPRKPQGHHVLVDVKFLVFQIDLGEMVKHLQYAAIDHCTRIKVLKVYARDNRTSSIDFMDYVVDKFPFHKYTVQINNGHKFQSKFNSKVKDLGREDCYTKPVKLQYNGKVERSHLTDKRELHQMLSYSDDVNLNNKISQWEGFYNFERPNRAFKGKTPYKGFMYHLKNKSLVPF